MPNPLHDIHGEASFRLATPLVELFVTRRGGHMAPVSFQIGERNVFPYALAPWLPREFAGEMPVILQVLRGDFFCLPFGPAGEEIPVHGDTANGEWNLVESSETELVLEMHLPSLAGKVLKRIQLESGHRAIYQENTVSGVEGKFSMGYHAILQFPETGGPYKINTSPFHFGSTNPTPAGDPAIGEYSILEPNTLFTSLAEVPLATGGTTSLHDYPNRPGYEDIAMVSSEPDDFAWTAVTLDGYLWISLKNPQILPNTVFWMSNGGRHTPPWNGRHRRRMGLEEVCSHFADGLEVSREDRLQEKGVRTTSSFSSGKPTRIPSIHVVHPAPDDFGLITGVERLPGEAAIRVKNQKGSEVEIPVNWSFLYK